MIDVHYAVGHGDTPDGTHDPGATSRDGAWSEQTAGDHVVRAAAARSTSVGLDVRHEADRDDPNYVGTVAKANASGARRLVAVHHDWHKAPEGAFVHWYPGSAQGEAMADAILAAIEAAGFPIRADWHKPRGELYVLRRSTMPAVLVECGRIGQDTLDTRDELERMGRAIARGVHRHLDVTEPTDPPKPRPSTPAPDPDREPTSERFPDVFSDFGPAVDRVAAAGILTGWPDGTFRPRQPLTREAFAVAVDRLLDHLEDTGQPRGLAARLRGQ